MEENELMTYSCYKARKPTIDPRSTSGVSGWEKGLRSYAGSSFCNIKANSTYALIDEIAGQILESFQCQLRGVGRDQIAYEAHLKHERHLTVAILHPLFTLLKSNKMYTTLKSKIEWIKSNVNKSDEAGQRTG